MITQTVLHGQARKKILTGVNAIYNAVKITLGPEGAGVLLHRSFNRGARITNDGVTIAKCVEPKDEFENLVATAFKEAAAKTGERGGDGTTSTICVAGKLINDVLNKFDEKNEIQLRGQESEGVISLKKHILSVIPEILKEIKLKTKKLKTKEELMNIADVSLGGNKEVAKIVSEMVWKTGEDGFITLQDGFQRKLETEVIEGARFPMKVPATVFLNNPQRFEMIAEECDVIITNYNIDSLRDFASFWNNIQKNKLIIFAPNFSEEVLVQMVKLIAPKPLPNGGMTPSGIKIFPVKTPSLRTEQYEDLSIFCGANFINKDAGGKLKEISEYDLGFLDKLTVKSVEDREDAVLLGGKGEKTEEVKKRIQILKEQIPLTKMPEYKALLDKRIASLASAGGQIKVGAATDAEALPLKHKIEDAIFACQKALKYGYVKGGGLCLKEIAEEKYKKDELIYNALLAPYNQIQENTGQEFKIDDNIIDPAKVVELEIENGLGVAASMITVKAIIPEFDDRDPHDGEKEIAKSIMAYTMMWAKKEGLLEGGKDEAAKEQLQRYEHLISLEND